MATVGRLHGLLGELEHPLVEVVVTVDDAGVGGGVTDRASERRMPVRKFIGASRASKPQRFGNRRAEAAWGLAEELRQGLIDLDPADTELTEQLLGATYHYDSAGPDLP